MEVNNITETSPPPQGGVKWNASHDLNPGLCQSLHSIFSCKQLQSVSSVISGTQFSPVHSETKQTCLICAEELFEEQALELDLRDRCVVLFK